VAVKWWNIHEDNGDDVPRGLRKPGSHQKERRLWNRMMKKMSTHLKTAEESQENQRRKERTTNGKIPWTAKLVVDMCH
jgi:50S ribosomal subunit-associated GTPase HflX